MKKIILLLFLSLFLPSIVLAEAIDSIKVNIELNQDSTLKVEEKIDYDFGKLQKHGIYRDIVANKINISNIKVVDENNQNYNFETSHTGKNLQIKIGDADKLITGKHTYFISYQVKNALNFFADHDELYWNAVGTGWNIPINSAITEIKIPTGVDLAKINYTCYQGDYGANANCDNKVILGNSIVFTSNNLTPSQGQTIVLGFPKGYFAEPSFWQKHWLEILVFLLPIISFVVMFYLWYTRGRDPKGQGTIITQFDVPDNLTPVQVGTLVDHTMQAKDLTAEIVYLAVKGYLKITHLEKKGLFGKNDFILKRLKKSDDLPNEFDQALLHGLLMYADNEEIKISALKDKFYKDYQLIKKSVYHSLIKKEYYKSSPPTIIISYLVAGFILSALGILFMEHSWFVFLAFLLSGLCVGGFGLLMPARTVKGTEVKDYLLGFKNYLTVAEKDRLEFHNAPEKNAETFEKFLPFAIALGVEKVWAKQFADIYTNNPSWYDGGNQVFSSMLLVSSMSDFSSATTGMMTQASNGGSGFGGGGVGGGGGGGGGGSW
ncbi:MAG: hypothetical protein US42_C0009G0025 [Candidatus Magasanikbacteria bacterium GW2011_GWC2_37_14]|uniref:DUF2207 domain-containing protein n=1 Tax=Candidatus Magasanikbacteria bacterium GW2011_GWC2_37_14 TaxID=1619046 RepID=A0A0G0GMQ3_9BACT|nr:MAG: hypothetical protein US42_C0009G0025 [Candidatus Magasanikbacteria bacterium GW2011_GWC2_37_14]